MARIAAQAKLVGYPDMDLLVNRVLASRPTGEDLPSPRSRQWAAILTARYLALADPDAARQMLPDLASFDLMPRPDKWPERDECLLQAWVLADSERVAKMFEPMLAGGFDTFLGYRCVGEALELLTTPPPDRLREVLRRQEEFWFPGRGELGTVSRFEGYSR